MQQKKSIARRSNGFNYVKAELDGTEKRKTVSVAPVELDGTARTVELDAATAMEPRELDGTVVGQRSRGMGGHV
jgi:hypothetical protein